MSWQSLGIPRIRGLFQKNRLQNELDEELQTHLDMLVEENIARGMSAQQARRAAMVTLGNQGLIRESYREQAGLPFFDTLLQDLRYGVRVLRKNPGFTLVAILALALGIGANTALFSVVYGVLLRPLPYAQGDRLVVLRQKEPLLGIDNLQFSVKEIQDYRAQVRTMDQLEEYHSMQFILLGRQPDRVQTGVVSAGFFNLLGVRPLLGRTFVSTDEQQGADPVLVLSYNYWQRAFGGDPNIIGQTFKMNDRMHTVIGVLPPIPQYPRENDVYMTTNACPFRSGRHHLEDRGMRMMELFGRLKPGVPLATASAEVRSIAEHFVHDYPDYYPAGSGFSTTASSLHVELTQRARPLLLLLMGTTALVLLICCTNVANLALARVLRREHELGVRAALGASRRRLMRQLLTESTLLALAGGAIGLLIASATTHLLTTFVARFTSRASEVSVNAPVLLFTLGLSLLTGLLFGSLPALAAGRGNTPLQSAAVTSTPKIEGRSIRNGLMVAQLAVSFVLLSAAGLMIRSFVKLQSVDAGYNAENVLTLTLPFNWSKYNKPEKTLAYDDQILERVGTLPGVMAVGLTSGVPLDARGPNFNSFKIEGRPVEKGHADPMLNVTLTSPGAFRTLGIPLVKGRLIEEDDRPGRMDVGVASQSLARHYWGNEDPINKRITFDGEHWVTIVGIVGDIKQFGLDREPADTLYLALAQNPGGQSLSMRTASDPMSVASLVRQTVRSIDAEQAITDVKTLTELRSESLVGARVTTLLLGLFAGLALVIAATGLTGVTAFLVSQRTREIGIRIALGAQVRQVLAMVLSHGVRLILIGAALGLAISLLTTKLMKDLLYGVKTVDWPTLIGVGLVLVCVSVLASYMPARRACKIDPMVAMRTE